MTRFADEEVQWISGQRPSAKRAGVLPPFAKFPTFVDRVESVVKGTRNQAADMTYQKFSFALFKWLEAVAKSDDKYTDVVMLENCHFFFVVFSARQVPALQQAVNQAKDKYQEHLRRYVEWSIEYEMPQFAKFFSNLTSQLKSVGADDIMFTNELSKHDLRNLIKNYLQLSKLSKSVLAMLQRIHKHLPKNSMLVREVWEHLADAFLVRFQEFEKLVSACYQNEKLPFTMEALAATVPRGSAVSLAAEA